MNKKKLDGGIDISIESLNGTQSPIKLNSDSKKVLKKGQVINTEDSDKSSISEDQSETNNRISSLTSNSSKRNKKTKKNKYIAELQNQIQETKDRAIQSLVEKEKSFMKERQEFKRVQNKLLKEINSLKNSLQNNENEFPVGGSGYNMFGSEEKILQNQIKELKIERDNTVKKLTLDFQTLMAKYEDDVSYYKDMMENIPRKSVETVGPEFIQTQSSQNQVSLKILDELKDNEEHYLKEQKMFQRKITELEEKVEEYKNMEEPRESMTLSMNDFLKKESMITKLQKENKQLNKNISDLEQDIEFKTDEISILEEDLAKESNLVAQLHQKVDDLSCKLTKSEKELKQSMEDLENERIDYKNSVINLEKELTNTKDIYETEISQLRVNVKTKESALKSLNEQFGEEDFDKSIDGIGSISKSDLSGSLFDELGGESSTRSMSIVPKGYKIHICKLKKKLKHIEDKCRGFKAEVSKLKEDKAQLESKLDILEKQDGDHQNKIQELDKMHQKEIKSLQNRARAAFAEIQNLKKKNVVTSNNKDKEVHKLEARIADQQTIIDALNSQNKMSEDDLMTRNLKWAQENNELTCQLMEVEKQLIESKLHMANLASMNDRLKHSNNEKKKKIKELNYYLHKYNIEAPAARNETAGSS
ncbi:unnamed protein product [Moneuplotes crassus]|uniref:Uncharacterized protein n=1 Tax=Euplotes crassus TaxID=5936 RepID=A0AAD2D1K9_EUPCR|nr:unnamed protein product [Moneuplotes crassus]